jgi:hypothetical protein
VLCDALRSMVSFSYATRSIKGGCYLSRLSVWHDSIPSPKTTLATIEKMRRNVFNNTFTTRSWLF